MKYGFEHMFKWDWMETSTYGADVRTCSLRDREHEPKKKNELKKLNLRQIETARRTGYGRYHGV